MIRSVSTCAATVTPTQAPAGSGTVYYATTSGSNVIVTETNTLPPTAYGFNLTVLCGGS